MNYHVFMTGRGLQKLDTCSRDEVDEVVTDLVEYINFLEDQEDAWKGTSEDLFIEIEEKP